MATKAHTAGTAGPSVDSRDALATSCMQDDRNILYANLVLPSTLFAAVQTGDVLRQHRCDVWGYSRRCCHVLFIGCVLAQAYMTLTLPTGYECVRFPAKQLLSLVAEDT